MSALSREMLYSLEEYAEKRPQIRKNVIATKKIRNVHLGDHVLFMFENVETIQYQIQEMLRIEKIFESEGIQEELDVYNPLIPDGNNLKATLMIEYDDVEERRKALAKLIGIEKKIYFQVNGGDKVYPICNEDLDRETEEKTSSVHFARFEFSDEMIADFKSGKEVKIISEHPEYLVEMTLGESAQSELAKDFS